MRENSCHAMWCLERCRGKFARKTMSTLQTSKFDPFEIALITRPKIGEEEV